MNKKANSLLAIAQGDVAAAKTLLPVDPSRALFFVAQAAEKIVKAVLAQEGLTTPAHHQIDQLLNLLPADHVWQEDFADFIGLARANTIYRYPTPGGEMPQEPDAEEVRDRLNSVAAILPEVRAWCSVR